MVHGVKRVFDKSEWGEKGDERKDGQEKRANGSSCSSEVDGVGRVPENLRPPEVKKTMSC